MNTNSKSIKGFLGRQVVPIVLIIMSFMFAFISPNFLTVSNAITVLRQISMLCVMATGVSLVMVTGCIDLSVASVASLGGVITALLMSSAGWSMFPASLVGLVFATIVGCLNGVLITFTNMNPMIATLGTSTALKGVAYLLAPNGSPIYGLPDSAKFLGQGNVFGSIPVPIIVMIICLILNYILLNRMLLGRQMYAVGSNEEVARLSGINGRNVRIIAYAFSGFFSGLSGLILMSRINSGHPNAAAGYDMDVLTACIVGGISIGGGKGGTLSYFIGCLIIGIINNGLTIVRVSEYWQMIARGAILVFAVAMDSVIKIRAEKVKKQVKQSK